MRPTLALVVLLSIPSAARAHHEAIFGPQSSLMFSSDGFASLQAFSARLGRAPDRTQESTLVLSGGVSPFRSVPVSLSLLVPVTLVAPLDGGERRLGAEDAVLGARYRLDLTGLQRRFDRSGNFVLGMAGIEVPTGTLHDGFLRGSFGWMGAALASLERGPWSAISYVFYHRHLPHHGETHGSNLFAGTGVAFSPWDDPATGRLLSVQLGASYELATPDRLDGRDVPGTGGWSVLAHPTAVVSPGGHVLLFALASIPLVQRYDAPAAEPRWRVGAGVIYLFDH
jgi:hypothetical protein